MEGNDVAGHGILNIGGSVASHISTAFNIASNSGFNLKPSNSHQEDDLGGISTSQRGLVNEPTV
jgi:hypothetical protein